MPRACAAPWRLAVLAACAVLWFPPWPVLLAAAGLAAWQRTHRARTYAQRIYSPATLPAAAGRARSASCATIWLGQGGAWRSRHTAALYATHAAEAPAGALASAPARGRWSRAVACPAPLLARHVLALGAPGAGKSTLLVLLAWQAQRRGEAVVVIDPKGSAALRRQLALGARVARRPFLCLQPASPDQSVRYDPLATCTTAQAIAERLCRLISAEHHDPFREFSRGAILAVAEALAMTGAPVTLAALQDHLADAGARLLPVSPGGSPALQALVTHDRTHYRKMLAPLFPVLAQLGTGAAARVLVPGGGAPALQVGDLRRQGTTLYVGLEALGAPALAGLVSQLLLEDLAAEASQTLRQAAHVLPLHLAIDEAGEVACPALLQLLGKGREAGVGVWLAIQTLADLEWRLGSRAASLVAQGNLGAWFLFRQLDAASRQESAARLGEVPVRSERTTASTSQRWSGGLGGRTASSGVSWSAQAQPRIPEAVFATLPDRECLAHLPDGTLLHLCLPRLCSP